MVPLFLSLSHKIRIERMQNIKEEIKAKKANLLD